MQVFDFQITDKELGAALGRIYQTELAILKYDFEFHCEEAPRRLALVTLEVQTPGSIKTVDVLVKESSEYELTVLSLMNKLLPYSCPRVIYHMETPSALFLLLENIPTWVDIDGRHRVNELLVDGLYVIQATFFDYTQTLLRTFKPFPVVTKERLLKTGTLALTDIDEMSGDPLFAEVFKEYSWDVLKKSINKRLAGIKDYEFPMTLVHGNYYPNTVRAMRDSRGRVHVVVYDWQNAAVGWPQIDLVLLLDRLDILAAYQNLLGPSSALLQRYISTLVDEFDIDVEMFYRVYRVCYLCRMLPLMRWWMRGHKQHPMHDPDRVFLEIRTKLGAITELQECQE